MSLRFSHACHAFHAALLDAFELMHAAIILPPLPLRHAVDDIYATRLCRHAAAADAMMMFSIAAAAII